MASRTVSVRLPPETLQRLSVLAQTMQRPRAWLMARAIERFVEQEAWQIEAIQHAVSRHDSGEAKSVDHDKVAEWLESWGTKKELEPPSCE